MVSGLGDEGPDLLAVDDPHSAAAAGKVDLLAEGSKA